MKGVIKMIEQIDVRDLPEMEVRFVQQLVDLLKAKTKEGAKKEGVENTAGKKIKLPTYPLGAIQGNLSRREIYDYL